VSLPAVVHLVVEQVGHHVTQRLALQVVPSWQRDDAVQVGRRPRPAGR
jgi:hypothetical protein